MLADNVQSKEKDQKLGTKKTAFTTIRKFVEPKTENQKIFYDTAKSNIITFGEGPAGSGKTLLAVGIAVEAFLSHQVNKIVITRPTIEAGGEKLGYLPGDYSHKVLPYILPMFDAFGKFMSQVEMDSLLEKKTIEIAPIGFLRGRNLDYSFIIVDEAQNCTMDQMKLILTRIGKQSKMIINGDIHQSDLPHHKRGALETCMLKLDGLEGIGVCHLSNGDIIRHPIIGRILERLA